MDVWRSKRGVSECDRGLAPLAMDFIFIFFKGSAAGKKLQQRQETLKGAVRRGKECGAIKGTL